MAQIITKGTSGIITSMAPHMKVDTLRGVGGSRIPFINNVIPTIHTYNKNGNTNHMILY